MSGDRVSEPGMPQCVSYQCLLAVVQLAVSIWLYAGISKGIRSAWTVQIVYSAFGLMGFPLGTLINGYLLSQWFRDDTKAWFGA